MINFILGIMIGGFCGIGLMCLLQISRDNELEQENKRLKEEYVLLQNASDEYEDGLQQKIDKVDKYIDRLLNTDDTMYLDAVLITIREILGGDVDDEI